MLQLCAPLLCIRTHVGAAAGLHVNCEERLQGRLCSPDAVHSEKSHLTWMACVWFLAQLLTRGRTLSVSFKAVSLECKVSKRVVK